MKNSEYSAILSMNIQYIKGIGEKRAGLFNKLGIYCMEDLIQFYPRKYLNWQHTTTVNKADNNSTVFIKATMITPVKESLIRKGLTLYKCNFTDGETVIHVTIFNNKYLAKSLRTFDEYILFGKIEKGFTFADMASPQIERADCVPNIQGVYPSTAGLNSNAIAKTVKTALEALGNINETLNEDILKKYSLCPLDFAVKSIHFPKTENDIEIARKRLIFEELLTLQIGLLRLKGKKKSSNSFVIEKDYTNEFYSLLPFEPTNAQKQAINDINNDMKSNKSMNRLIQGDVGSGKTAVAAAAIYNCIENGCQAALMVPTEILANQHYETFTRLFENTSIRCSLLIGSLKASEKKELKRSLIDGKTDLVIGTHAIIQNDVEFKNLALVVTDEQHRFGVEQRASLAMKSKNPHMLVMSATPIPRTLALIIYGDLDISILNELPPGRRKVRCDIVNSSYHERIYTFIKKQIDAGNKAYIVCPLVEEGENEMIAAEQYAEYLANNAFKGYSLALLHGKMKAKDKEKVMNDFADGETDILVSTTVVEVGVDVKNATVMLIENAERFGLSQLHQLRGRVGRGERQSYCILVSDSKSENARNRLNALKKTSDGFKIADYDLKTRGPGDFFGKRQHGLPNLIIADMLKNADVLVECRQCAKEILEKDKNLTSFPILKNNINNMFKKMNY